MKWEALLGRKVALITGAASGQGRAAAVLFARHGARVVVVDVNAEGSTETRRLVEEVGGEAIIVHADVSRKPDVEAMISQTLDLWDRLDVLYNNAAIQMSGRLLDCTEEQWDITLRTNLTAVFWACRAALPAMVNTGKASIINTSSVLGLIGSEGYAAYGAAKAGLVALTRQIASEYGPAVRANVIAPGSIDTPRFREVAERTDDPDAYLETLRSTIPLRRLGLADDVASTALFLASDASSYVSGAVVPADGGLGVYR